MAPQRAVLDYNKLSLLLLIGAVFYNELIAYYSAYTRWPDLKWPTDSLRILFVADPQIQGVMYESPFPLGPITRWDSDRYLSKSFSWAIYAYSPQIVVFLGDLIDEGDLLIYYSSSKMDGGKSRSHIFFKRKKNTRKYYLGKNIYLRLNFDSEWKCLNV